MTIDHIFIFTDDKGKVAEELVDFGLSEGSNRIHVGQGTANRKFYFENFFLEILWVHNVQELTSDKTKPMGLWERAEYQTTLASPFGLCLVHTEDTDSVFKNALKYQPAYFPPGMEIDILKNEDQTDLPWTFRLPFRGQEKHDQEPTVHKNGIARLTRAVFEYKTTSGNEFLEKFKNQSTIQFMESSRNWLHLIFDHGNQGKRQDFENLNLTITH